MTNQLQVYQGMAFGELTPEDITTIRQTIGKDCNESQFKLFMSISKASGANPVMNEIYPTVRQGQLTVQFGVDFFVRKAKESEGYQGYDVQTVHENDEFKMHQAKGEDGRYYAVIDEHSWGFPRGKVIGGYAVAYREGFKPFTVVMEVEEVEHLKKSNIGMQKTMWNNYFNDMFKKHMVRRALKAAFELSFDDDNAVESNENEVPEYKPKERKDITPTQETIEQPEEKEESQQEDPIKALRAEMKQKFVELGITTNQAIGEYIKKNKVKLSDPATEAELVGLIQLLDMHIGLNDSKKSDQPNDDDLLE
ncbi:RecT family recombinase [Pseudogracilibacillus auburnensis]|uniref:RecT family recombinase n=1 Tax=Pseudogracilibacillus auburnensis TaxID=1494959 RepID=UPI001A97AC2F|nr:RecT family recombinase [Pseudogracilibacillus auburnensis]MBO1003148.1 recombinase RecT [Pseudogracilibacillus auburnensis]